MIEERIELTISDFRKNSNENNTYTSSVLEANPPSGISSIPLGLGDP